MGVYCVLQTITDSCMSGLFPLLLGIYIVKRFQVPEAPQCSLFMGSKFDNFLVEGCPLWVCTAAASRSPLLAGNITWPHYIFVYLLTFS